MYNGNICHIHIHIVLILMHKKVYHNILNARFLQVIFLHCDSRHVNLLSDNSLFNLYFLTSLSVMKYFISTLL